MEKKRLFVDMDGTLARFHDQVNYLERMFEKDFFRELEPFDNMVEGVRQFIKDHPDVDVYILSAKVIGEPPYCEMEKHAWMDMHLPEIPAERRIFTEMGRPKAEFIPGGVSKNDFILDDYNKGLNQWMYDGGSAIKCHNNINQRGLGAHGGRAGNLWVGPMVHTDDKPEMIAAELASHMGLEYDLAKVASAYPDISLSISEQADKKLLKGENGLYAMIKSYPGGSVSKFVNNPLNGIRALDGNEAFSEIRLYHSLDKHFGVPAFQISDICKNVYEEADFMPILRDSGTELASVVASAIQQAQLPIVGQIDYLHTDGQIGYSQNFYDVDEMKQEIRDSHDCGRPIDVVWNVMLPPTPMREMDFFELSDKFFYDYKLNEDQACFLAHALLKPAQERTEGETLALTQFWQNASPPTHESLSGFLGTSVKPGLDSLIRHAEHAQQSQSSAQGTNTMTPNGR